MTPEPETLVQIGSGLAALVLVLDVRARVARLEAVHAELRTAFHESMDRVLRSISRGEDAKSERNILSTQAQEPPRDRGTQPP